MPDGAQKAWGLTENDWLVLMMLSGNPERVKTELDRWISAGYIDKARALGIWNELDARVRTEYALIRYGVKEFPEDRERRLAREKVERELGEQAEQQRLAAAWRQYEPIAARAFRPKPLEYGPALEEMRVGFREEMPKTERWRDWFRSKYPRLIEQFEAKVPEAERRKKTWAEYLKKQEPEIREQWYGMTPYERGERPSAFAPRIQTVGPF